MSGSPEVHHRIAVESGTGRPGELAVYTETSPPYAVILLTPPGDAARLVAPGTVDRLIADLHWAKAAQEARLREAQR